MPSGLNWTRRSFLRRAAAGGLAWSWPSRSRASPSVFPVHFRKSSPYELLRPQIDAGHDDFEGERGAVEIEARWSRILATRTVALAGDFRGVSPMPVRYRQIAKGAFAAEFYGGDRRFQAGLKNWFANLGEVRRARFFALPGDRLRYKIASTAAGMLDRKST